MSFLAKTKDALDNNANNANNVSVRQDGDRRVCTIDDRLYMDSGKDDIFVPVPLGMDDARDGKSNPRSRFVVRNDTAYQIVDGNKYMEQLKAAGAKTVSAKKSGKIAILDPEDGKFTTYTSNGHVEAEETVQQGYHVVAKADENGQPILDDYGHMNVWQIEETKLRKRYADIPEEIKPGMSFAPAGAPQDFVQVDKNVAVMCPWGEGGSLIPQTVDAGGYLTSASANDCYGIGAAEFDETYKVLQDKTAGKEREIPEIEGESDSLSDDYEK